MAILSVLPDYQDPYIPSQAKASLPTMMMKFFNPGLEDLEWARLFQQALCSSYDWVTDVETDQVKLLIYFSDIFETLSRSNSDYLDYLISNGIYIT